MHYQNSVRRAFARMWMLLRFPDGRRRSAELGGSNLYFFDTQISKEQKILIKVDADPRSGSALQHLQIHITAGTGSVRPTFVKISSSFLFAET